MAAILVVDDDVEMAELIQHLLELDGHHVRMARNGEEGIAELALRLPDVVVLDIEMPILDGPGMAYRMFVRDAGMEAVPIVLSSGAAHASQVADEIGTPYFLAKPYGYAELSHMVRRALSEKIPSAPKPST